MHARMLMLHHKTVESLLRKLKEAEIEGEYRVAKRLRAIIMKSEGHTSGEIASVLKAPRSCVSDWIRNYVEYGFEGLQEGYRSGRPAELTTEQKSYLADIVESGPTAYGFLTGVWSAISVAEVIRDEFGISYDPRHVRRILDELNFSIQRPKRVLANADPKKQSTWRRYTYPNIKKKRGRKAQP